MQSNWYCERKSDWALSSPVSKPDEKDAQGNYLFDSNGKVLSYGIIKTNI
jgi:hypothetical protein